MVGGGASGGGGVKALGLGIPWTVAMFSGAASMAFLSQASWDEVCWAIKLKATKLSMSCTITCTSMRIGLQLYLLLQKCLLRTNVASLVIYISCFDILFNIHLFLNNYATLHKSLIQLAAWPSQISLKNNMFISPKERNHFFWNP